ncbi:MAG: hypothetical protein L0Y44_00130 [Phycisphaerales bacterium]|nr:hypothetical protein [Phycisphaerales bacterium]MCI0676868.1 hypothetical protein [Phycisphaerales bacterium]
MPPVRKASATASLQQYRAKRNFTRTPEPSGKGRTKTHAAKTKAKPRLYCMQKHLASQLHYDLRLEHNGVLLSWAVPKGPSVSPADKRLAMRVEDHPLDYGEFEGVIPEGYGAGIVLLWDKGTWTPLPPTDDVDAALKKGELKFELQGVKLKGSWVLVRTSGGYGGGGSGGESRSWLLIKHRDQWTGDFDITEVAAMSVKSFGDFEDILAQDKPDIWLSNKPPARGGQAGAMFQKIIERAMKLKESKKPSKTPAHRRSQRRNISRKGAKAQRKKRIS